jgi:hypothetical protein
MTTYRTNTHPPVEDKPPPVSRDKPLAKEFAGGVVERRKGRCRCTEPGFLLSLWAWMTFRGFVKNDVWRCPHGRHSRYLGDGVWTDLSGRENEEESAAP